MYLVLVAKPLNCNRLRWPCYHTTQSVFHKSITLWSCNYLLGGLFLNIVAASLPHVQCLVPKYTNVLKESVSEGLSATVYKTAVWYLPLEKRLLGVWSAQQIVLSFLTVLLSTKRAIVTMSSNFTNKDLKEITSS